MSTWAEGRRPITIAILAMGGEGGGVLADWIVSVGEHAGYISQNTSVAGVAQRTGATVYYVELYPPAGDVAPGGRSEPILSLFPTPGEVDVVIASELMEAGRAVQRGFCTPDRTVLITSTNRVYSINERIAPGDGRVDSVELLQIAEQGARRLIAADFATLASQAKSVISASLFGALAGSTVLPFTRDQFEAAISASGKGREASLAAFAAGFSAAQLPTPTGAGAGVAAAQPVAISIGQRPADIDDDLARERRRSKLALASPTELVGPALHGQAERVRGFPAAARSMLLHGCARTAVYQDTRYTDRYLDRISRVAEVDPDTSGDARLTTSAARYVALWMCYQDTIHVALQKIRHGRLAEVRREAHADPDQLLQVREYLHPQLEEVADTLPTRLGRWVGRSRFFGALIGRLSRKGMVVNTTSVVGFTMLWIMARMRPLRPRSLRFGEEQVSIDAWIDQAVATARRDPGLAYEIVECQRVLKGYGETRHHGQESFAALMAAATALVGRADAAPQLARLRDAALADESGAGLRTALQAVGVDALPAVS